MGNPRRLRKKYARPGHPWQSARIESERAVMRDYGLKTKRELWKFDSRVKSFANDMKRLLALRTEQADFETKQLLSSLSNMGLISSGASSDDVLALTATDLLERRLQTQMVRKGLANSMKQARQFISHGHVTVGGKVVCAPSYIVTVKEEPTISFVEKSELFNPEHPARQKKKSVVEVKAEEAESEENKPKKKPSKAGKKEAPKKEAKPVKKKPSKSESKETEKKEPDKKEAPKEEKEAPAVKKESEKKPAPKEEPKAEEKTAENTEKSEDKQ